jgi:hypothetical protein
VGASCNRWLGGALRRFPLGDAARRPSDQALCVLTLGRSQRSSDSANVETVLATEALSNLVNFFDERIGALHLST